MLHCATWSTPCSLSTSLCSPLLHTYQYLRTKRSCQARTATAYSVESEPSAWSSISHASYLLHILVCHIVHTQHRAVSFWNWRADSCILCFILMYTSQLSQAKRRHHLSAVMALCPHCEPQLPPSCPPLILPAPLCDVRPYSRRLVFHLGSRCIRLFITGYSHAWSSFCTRYVWFLGSSTSRNHCHNSCLANNPRTVTLLTSSYYTGCQSDYWLIQLAEQKSPFHYLHMNNLATITFS